MLGIGIRFEYTIWIFDYLFVVSILKIKIRFYFEERISWLVDLRGNLYFYRFKY